MKTRIFALLLGIVYLLVGASGLFLPSGLSMTIGPTASLLLGIFPVNLLHNLFHLAIGVWGLASYSSDTRSTAYSHGSAVLFGLLTLLGLIPITQETFGLATISGAYSWLYLVSTLSAAYFAWIVPDTSSIERTRTASPARRH